jgi:hypothetical protein
MLCVRQGGKDGGHDRQQYDQNDRQEDLPKALPLVGLQRGRLDERHIRHMFILARNGDLISRHCIHGRHRGHLDDIVHLVAGLQYVNGCPIKFAPFTYSRHSR